MSDGGCDRLPEPATGDSHQVEFPATMENLGLSEVPWSIMCHQHNPAPGRYRSPLMSTLSAMSPLDRKSTRLNSSHANISYAVFCLKKKKHHKQIARIGDVQQGGLRRALLGA